MTSPDTELTAADRAQTFIDWTRVNSRVLKAGFVVVFFAALGCWFWSRSQQIKAANAEAALMRAKQSMTAGNLALAQTDLQKVYANYESTSAGVEAAMLLAQIDYDNGKYQDGITRLRKVAGSSAAQSSETTIRSLEGDGYAQMGKVGDAAKAYEDAANSSPYENEKAYQISKAARSYQAAGDTAKARALWTS